MQKQLKQLIVSTLKPITVQVDYEMNVAIGRALKNMVQYTNEKG